METLKMARIAAHMSQRTMAKQAKVAYKTLQLLESGEGNPSLEVLTKLAKVLSLCGPQFQSHVAEYFVYPPDSVYITSRKIMQDGKKSWKIHLFNFVDAFQRNPEVSLIADPPHSAVSAPIAALLASTVETLCDDHHMIAQPWCSIIAALPEPWFVAGIENLKATALIESPVHFRKRNIFVLASFLERA
jgi:DNA-binding XRE family transcriptional regulator